MGEDKKEEQKNEEVKEEQNKEEEPPEIVLKVDMHCEACARKVARALKGFGGIEEVTADSKSNKVVVKGKEVDILKVAERLQKKSGRKVEVLSPLLAPPETQEGQNTEQKEDKKEEPPPVITVVLNIQMHCEACAQALRKRIRKIKGVESVETDISKSQVVVKGVIDPPKLVDDVYKKTKKKASLVKEEEKKEEKKEEKTEAEEEEKKEIKENLGDQNTSTEIKRNEYWPSTNYQMGYAYDNYPPQFFSDENPNACSIM